MIRPTQIAPFSNDDVRHLFEPYGLDGDTIYAFVSQVPSGVELPVDNSEGLLDLDLDTVDLRHRITVRPMWPVTALRLPRQLPDVDTTFFIMMLSGVSTMQIEAPEGTLFFGGGYQSGRFYPEIGSYIWLVCTYKTDGTVMVSSSSMWISTQTVTLAAMDVES